MTSTLLENVRRLTPEIQALAVQIEHDRALPASLVEQLHAAGVFRSVAPRALGGLELAPSELVGVLEELGYADGSVGWCSMIGAVTGVALGYLSEDTAAALLDEPRFLIAGVAAPLGRATPVEGGYRVSGRWPFASGCRDATWLVGGAMLAPGSTVRMMIMKATDVIVHDTWDVAGLRGTGSHDIEAVDVLVPAARTFSLAEAPVQPGAVYAVPPFSVLSFGIAAVALGIARAAITEFAALARRKRSPFTQETIAAKPAVRTALAEAEALRASGLAHLCAELREPGTAVADRARLRLAVATATRNAARAVDLVYNAAGGSAVYSAGPLQRHFRDVHVATQHAMVSTDVVETAGAVLLGEPVRTAHL